MRKLDIDQSPPVLKELDAIELEILRLLQSNCDQSIDEIKRKIDARLQKRVPRSTVHAKIKRMEREERITARKAILDGKKVGKEVTAFILLKYKGIPYLRARKESAEAVIRDLKNLPEVQEIHVLTGPHDIIVKLKTETVSSLANIVLKQIREIEGIVESSTALVLETHRERTEIAI